MAGATAYFSTNTELGLVNALTQSLTVYLPQNSPTGKNLFIKDAAGNSLFSTVTIQAQGSDTFEDGSTKQLLNSAYESMQLTYNPTKWYITGGTMFNTMNISSVITNNLNATNISSSYATVSSLSLLNKVASTNTFNVVSSLLYYNNNLVGGGFREAIPQNVNTYISTQVFLPNTISNLSFWLDASFSTSIAISSFNNTNLCTAWFNRGGSMPTNFVLSTNTFATAPTFSSILSTNTINNLPGIVFNSATTNYLSNKNGPILTVASGVTNYLNSEFTTFVTFIKQQSSQGTMTCLQNTGNNFLAIYTNQATFGQSGQPIVYTTPSNLPSVIVYTRQGGNTIGRINGSNTVNSNYPNTIPFGGNFSYILGFDTNGNYYNGSLHEILQYNISLQTTDIQRVEGYLAWKWGFQSNLINSHPFRFLPPY